MTEVDETFIGGRSKNMYASKRRGIRGLSGKAMKVGAKDRDTNQARAQVIKHADRETLQGFVVELVDAFAEVYTDEHHGYKSLPYRHESVRHNIGKYVSGVVSTNGNESYWAMFKRGYKGIYHWMRRKHLNRYVQEFAGRHNLRRLDTLDQMKAVVLGLEKKRLRYRDLVG